MKAYNSSNELFGRAVASKLSQQQADDFFYQSEMKIRKKRKFFTLRPPARKQREISGWVQQVKWCLHIGQQMPCSHWISGISYIKIPLIQWLGWILKMVAVERIIEGDLKRWRLAWPRRWFGHNDDIYYVLSEVALTLSGERLKSVTFGHVKDLCFRLPPLHSKWRHHPPILSVSKGPWGLWYL